MRRILAAGTATLLVALGLPAIAEQSATARVQSEDRARVQQLQNQLAQLEQTLRNRTADRQDNVQEWQQRYEQKLDELRERQWFESRYLSHE